MQLLQWQKRQTRANSAERWVLKTPHHLGYADVLLDVFPGAARHPDPSRSARIRFRPSASMITALWVLVAEKVDPKEVARLWSAKMATALRRCLEVRDRHPGSLRRRVVPRCRAGPGRAGAAHLRVAGLALHAGRRGNGCEAFMATNPREGRPPHQYTLEEFGLSADGIARDFKAYRERFIFRPPLTEVGSGIQHSM